MPVPRSRAAPFADVTAYTEHEPGGYFAARERQQDHADDVRHAAGPEVGVSDMRAGASPVLTSPCLPSGIRAALAACPYRQALWLPGAPPGQACHGVMTETRMCERCGTGFEPRREHARFCSAQCRITWNRDQATGQLNDDTPLSWSVMCLADSAQRLGKATGVILPPNARADQRSGLAGHGRHQRCRIYLAGHQPGETISHATAFPPGSPREKLAFLTRCRS